MNPLRILVTGSRDWRDRDAVRAGLVWALGVYATIGTPVLVHGGQRSGARVLARGAAGNQPGGTAVMTRLQLAMFGIGMLLVGIVVGFATHAGSMASHEEAGYLRGAADGYNNGRTWAVDEAQGRRILGVAPDHIESWDVPWSYPAP